MITTIDKLYYKIDKNKITTHQPPWSACLSQIYLERRWQVNFCGNEALPRLDRFVSNLAQGLLATPYFNYYHFFGIKVA